MTNTTILIVALQQEFNPSHLPTGIRVYYSGIGKINACMATLKAIHECSPRQIINFGTAGSVNDGLSGLLPVSRVVQRDVITSLAPRGQMPLCPRPVEYETKIDGYTCGTGDTFVTEQDPWLDETGVHLVDMELFAIAAVAHEYKIPWHAYKYVTDKANDNSVTDWKSQMHLGEQLYLEKLRQLGL
jgi:adenosylhomocysteine nucleosidase